jgi:6-phosphogluconolactonase
MTTRAASTYVYFGTTTSNTSEGIYVSRFDLDTGELSPAVLAAKTTEPLFINFHPNKSVLYAIGERKNTDGKQIGTVESFTVDAISGLLAPLNHQYAGDDSLCYVAINSTGHTALGVSYNQGFVVSFPLHDDGSLGPRLSYIRHNGASVNKERQAGPHAHCIDLDPANRFALVADLGLDKVYTYALDKTTSALTQQGQPFSTKPGAGPRHVTFDSTGRHVYLVNEIDSTLTLADYDAKSGHMTEQQTLPLLPSDFKGVSTAAEVVVDPSGKFLYASNRGYDSLALFTIAADTGRLTFVEYMRDGIKHPRHFAIDPTGHWLLCANRDADTITVYKIDPKTGRLAKTLSSIKIPMPTCVKFLAQ